MNLKEKFSAQLPAWRERMRKLVKESGDVKVGEVTIAQVYGGMRDVKCLVTDISYVDPNEGIRLRGFRLPTGGDQDDKVAVSPGDRLSLSLYWQADAPTDTPYTVFTHLVGPDGQLYGQWDNPPVRGTFPTTDWKPGESVVDQYEIPVSLNAPPGDYRLLIGLYDPNTGMRSPLLAENGEPAGDHVMLSQAIHVNGRDDDSLD